MTVHCLEIVTATNYPASDAKSDLDTYRENHSEVLDVFASELSVRNPAEDGSGTDHYHTRFRFAWSEDRQQLRQDAESWLSTHFDWWAWRYHECDHDEDDRSSCSWDSQSTSGNVPQDVLDYYT